MKNIRTTGVRIVEEGLTDKEGMVILPMALSWEEGPIPVTSYASVYYQDIDIVGMATNLRREVKWIVCDLDLDFNFEEDLYSLSFMVINPDLESGKTGNIIIKHGVIKNIRIIPNPVNPHFYPQLKV